MVAIKDYKHYTSEMLKSAYDKLGFVDKIFEPVEVVVDFGCADGAISEIIKLFYPNALVVGYDLPEVVELNDSGETVHYTSSLDEVRTIINGKTSLLVLNSVVHEIYNYERDPQAFLQFLFNMGFNYIWIRDLYIRQNYLPTDPKFVEVVNRLYNEYGDQVRDFAQIYGSIRDSKNFLHFLMKYKYVQNWDREVKEDYTLFGTNHDELKCQLDESGYVVVKQSLYSLPYTRNLIREEFGLELARNLCITHFYGLYKLKTK